MKVMGASVLIFEAIVVGLFIPVGYFNGLVASGEAAVWVGVFLVVACVVGAALVRQPYGAVVGWVIQLLVIATGFLVPMMFVLGGIFALLWWSALHFGRRADALSAGRTTASAPATPDAPGHRSA